jgi:hypothetical protein
VGIPGGDHQHMQRFLGHTDPSSIIFSYSNKIFAKKQRLEVLTAKKIDGIVFYKKKCPFLSNVHLDQRPPFPV